MISIYGRCSVLYAVERRCVTFYNDKLLANIAGFFLGPSHPCILENVYGIASCSTKPDRVTIENLSGTKQTSCGDIVFPNNVIIPT